jgi:exonuclease-1
LYLYSRIQALRAEAVPYIVAPYEADAQLAYLERIGLVDGIITEDSDLLVFGCQTVLTKLDSVSSTITSISRSDFASLTSSVTSKGKTISLLGWSDVQFRAMSILSGCDYLPSIPGVGLKTAWALLRKYKTAENVVRAVRLEGKKAVPRGYMEKYKKAERVFLYQRVWDPISERLVYLNDVPEGEKEGWDEDMEMYVGK